MTSTSGAHSGAVDPRYSVHEASQVMGQMLRPNPAIMNASAQAEFWVLNNRRTILRGWNGEALRPT